MFELEMDNINSAAGRLKSEITSTHLGDVAGEAVDHINQAVALIEAKYNERAAAVETGAPTSPNIDGSRGLIGDTEEVEEEETEADGTKKMVKKTVARSKK